MGQCKDLDPLPEVELSRSFAFKVPKSVPIFTVVNFNLERG